MTRNLCALCAALMLATGCGTRLTPPAPVMTTGVGGTELQDRPLNVMIEYTRSPVVAGETESLAVPLGPQFNIPGFLIEGTWLPIVPRARAESEPDFEKATYIARGQISLNRLLALSTLALDSRFVAFHADPNRDYDPPTILDCVPAGTGSFGLPADGLKIDTLESLGMTGKNVLILIVDTAINRKVLKTNRKRATFAETHSWPTGVTGTAGKGYAGSHGTMIAHVAAMAAPLASVAEVRSFGSVDDRISTASKAFDYFASRIVAGELLTEAGLPYSGIVVNNSWSARSQPGTADQEICEPHDVPDSQTYYSTNSSCHILNRMVGLLDRRQVDVVFSAGNTGGCATASVGHAGSIAGPNSLSTALTVGAADASHIRLSYSSQGAGVTTLTMQKPDLVAFSEFTGPPDVMRPSGTSAAAALVSGVIAAIRSKCGKKWTPGELRDILRRESSSRAWRADGTAVIVDKNNGDYDVGFGVLDARVLAKLGCGNQ